MHNSSSKNLIISKLTAASKGRTVFNEPSQVQNSDIYKAILPDAISCFKSELEAVNGHCFLCESEKDLLLKLHQYLIDQGISSVYCRDQNISELLKSGDILVDDESTVPFISMKAGVTSCEFLIARTGSVVVSSNFASGRQMNVFPPVHIVWAHVSQLVDYVEDAYVAIQQKYVEFLPSAISTITGPSRTADIEKTLVLGAHGPKELVVFLQKD
jgi:L-lactate dehydrogenase complex protein LldG